MLRISPKFPRYTMHDPLVPVRCVTPGEGRCMHRFFDTSPISPSGRYVAVLRLPFEYRLNAPGDEALVVLIDLHTAEEKVVATTRGWEMQMGANINWGPDDHTLLFNDVDPRNWAHHVVKLDPLTGKNDHLPGGIYQSSPCGNFISSSNMPAMRRTQYGYGVLLPDEHTPRNIGPRDDDGLFITDVRTGDRKLVFSLAQAVPLIPELTDAKLDDWEIYGFHSKWNPQGDRLIFTVRRYLKSHPKRFDLIGDKVLRFDVFTLKPDGSDAHNAVPSVCWCRGGHHINFCPDGRHLSMNLGAMGPGLLFYQVDIDGEHLHPLHYQVPGSGHPTLHPDGRHILTDTYAREPVAFGDGTVPLRWIDRTTWNQRCAVRIGAHVEPQSNSTMRVDPHPAWHRDQRHVTFNGVPGDNTRRVFIADFQPLLEQ